MGFVGDENQGKACDWDEDEENECGWPICDEAHNEGEYHQERSANDRSADHLESTLDVGDVCSGSGNEGARGELVDALE